MDTGAGTDSSSEGRGESGGEVETVGSASEEEEGRGEELEKGEVEIDDRLEFEMLRECVVSGGADFESLE